MARVEYQPGELDPNHQIVEGIRKTLANSQVRRVRTTLRAVDIIDLPDEPNGGTIEQKIAHVCQTLGCRHRCTGDEIIFDI